MLAYEFGEVEDVVVEVIGKGLVGVAAMSEATLRNGGGRNWE